jgi:hypothetical protein
MALPKGTRVHWNENRERRNRTGSIIGLIEGLKTYRVRRDEGGIGEIASRSLRVYSEKVLFLEGRLDASLASHREYGTMMKTWLSAQSVVMLAEKVHSLVDLRNFLRKEGNRFDTRLIHLMSHGYMEGGKPFLKLTHEVVDLEEEVGNFPRIPGKILLLSCCEVGQAAEVMQSLRDATEAQAVLAYRRDVNDDYSNLTEAMLYACLFQHPGLKLRTVIQKVHESMRSMGLRPDDRPAKGPVLDIYE